MQTRSYTALISLLFSGLLAGCSGDGAFTAVSPPSSPPPPPPGATTSAAGIWAGRAVTPDVADIVTGFEFNDTNGFSLGTAPFAAEFQGGITETRGNPALYTDGSFSWFINNADGSVDFATPGDTLSFSTRTVSVGNNATIRVLDESGVELSSTIVTNTFQQVVVNRNPGQSLIGSVVITVNNGEIAIDSFTFGYPSTASHDDIACLFTPEPDDDFACVVTDTANGDLIGGANGTFQVNGDQVTGAGTLYAAPGETLADGSANAPLTISAGTIEESDSLNLNVDSLGLLIAVTTIFDNTYDRGANLTAVAATYSTFDIFGDASSFNVDAAGVISGQTASGCMLSGQVSVINATANIYDVNLVANAATCGALGGSYNGLGTSQDDAVMNDTFLLAVFVDGQLMILGAAVK